MSKSCLKSNDKAEQTQDMESQEMREMRGKAAAEMMIMLRMDLWRLMQREWEEEEADTIWMNTHVLGSQWIYTTAIHLENKLCFLRWESGAFIVTGTILWES